MAERPDRTAGRADRILDAAGVLLTRLGYRKVTIEDIANQAGIGKGTIYLHWRAKEDLFQALLLRESVRAAEALLARLAEDPAEVLPHRFQRATFLHTQRNPLLGALITGNTELLGRLKKHPLQNQDAVVTERYLKTMIDRGLLRDIPNLLYSLRASALGFYLVDSFIPESTGLTPEEKADALAHIIRSAFEPPEEPSPADLAVTAAEVTQAFQDLISTYHAWIYRQDGAEEPV
ncbi:TetR/AcrR family transcriptional regulator [Amycolatopsis regifaucium]|uniref:TetR family transcriptional regulator n=1 Tax=Amycolatopsis regifaucium TaxID=546365 RepID=A0A154MU59_9PSEU|nr:TetR/AcrR family transcriptional regulator [Amycolatopsis regifaucium]KZB87811.1 TetR family transcriptional regulator [Amycolatopsis regifaucium]OKA08515.1 TetR family transcriptional regulator [Amycolatopsis regifaucium]SFI09323.1 DNA-binding transcriptional regulator, AcrR family [Amycolatopsis regifaucium]